MTNETNPRAPRDDEAPQIINICAQSGLFTSEELAGFSEQIAADAAAGTLGEQWRVAGRTGIEAAAFFGPEQMADGVWNLWFIAVLPDLRGSAIGTHLIADVERAVAKRGARLLIVETSGDADFAATRRFYRARGYEEEAKIRDWYGDGSDKIIFRKRM